MKSLHLAAITVSMFFTLFVTSQAYAPCIEGPGINCNGYPPPALSQIQLDKLNYETQNKPVITIVGVPSTAVHLEIDDLSSNIMFEHDLTLSSNGTTQYVLDISSYKSGGYSATATSTISKITSSFTVGMMTSGGNMVLNVDKNSYLPGEQISILGTGNSNTLIQLSLIDPYGTSIRSAKIFSDKTGHFSLYNFTIPTNAVSGIWQISATGGMMHVRTQIVVNSTNNPSGIKTNSVITSSPLKQFKSGIKPEYAQCSQNLHLIIKAEDGSFACVTIETGKNLAMRGWATTFSTGISTNDYYTNCDTPYPQSDTGIAVLYMPVNSIGKICVQYHNLNNTPTGIGMRIFDANDLTQNTSNVTAWTYDSTLEANVTKTIVYFIKTGSSAGFYGASLNCGGIPLAVGYDANSTITASDFPWVGHVFNCMVITYESHMEGTAGIGVRYIPYSYGDVK